MRRLRLVSVDHNTSQLIAIHGLSGSGKSVVSRRLEDHHGFKRASSGEICRSITESLFGHQERYALNEVSRAIRKIDKEIWIDAALRSVKGPRIVFDSVRYFDDAVSLKRRGFKIWKIFCPIEICIQRLKARQQVFELSDFNHDSEREIPDHLCSHIIQNNDRSLTELLAEVDSLIGQSG